MLEVFVTLVFDEILFWYHFEFKRNTLIIAYATLMTKINFVVEVAFNFDFWQGTFVWKCCVFNLNPFNKKTVIQFFEKGFPFSENLFQS